MEKIEDNFVDSSHQRLIRIAQPAHFLYFMIGLNAALVIRAIAAHLHPGAGRLPIRLRAKDADGRDGLGDDVDGQLLFHFADECGFVRFAGIALATGDVEFGFALGDGSPAESVYKNCG